MMPVDPQLLEILRCPESGARLVEDGERLVSTSPDSRRAYAAAGGLPNMIIEEATVLDPAAWAAVLEKYGVSSDKAE